MSPRPRFAPQDVIRSRPGKHRRVTRQKPWPDRLRAVIREAVLDALAVFLPVDCVGCGGANRSLCAGCRAQLVAEVTARDVPGGVVVYTALLYRAVARRSILALKEEGRTDLARPLGRPFAAAIAAARAASATPIEPMSVPLTPIEPMSVPLTPIELTVVPTSRAAWWRRGYDPVRLLCRRAGYRPVSVLTQTRRTRSQKTLGQSERGANLHKSMRARGLLTGRHFIVIDDVLTTGATFAEACRAVQEAGGTVLCGAALAFTPRIFRNTVIEKEVHSDIAG